MPVVDPARLEGVSPSVRALVARMLAKSPEARFPSALDLSRALRAARNPAWTADLDDATVALSSRSGSRGSAAAPLQPSPSKPRPPWLSLLR